MKKCYKLTIHVWLAGFVNIFALSLQLVELMNTHNSNGLSLGMCIGTLYIQFIYARLGQKEKNLSLMWCMYISFLLEIAIIVYVMKLRHGF